MAPETEPEPAKDETSEEPGAEPNLVLVEDANGETFVIPEELLASLSQCAIDAAAEPNLVLVEDANGETFV